MREGSCAKAIRCNELAVIVTDIFLALARERAIDGRVALDDLDRIAGLVRGGTMTLDNAFRTHEEKCRQLHSRPKGNVGTRSNPFQRLIVRPFERLLGDHDAIFPRAYLPNYFTYLEHAFGPRLTKLEAHCRSIVQALLVIHGNNLTWDHFYGDPRTVKTLTAALDLLVAHIQSPQGHQMFISALSRPVDSHAALGAVAIEQVRKTLVETHRGLAGMGH